MTPRHNMCSSCQRPKRASGGGPNVGPLSTCREGVRCGEAIEPSRKSRIANHQVSLLRLQASVGLGDYYGTLGGVVPHVDDPGPNTKLKKGDVKHRLPNIRTNPCSKGTYGFIGTTLGERMGRQGRGVVGEYSYMVSAGMDTYSSTLGGLKMPCQ